ncbi:hypothetical protein PJP10_30100 [Mycobacterium kansasii]
MTATSRLDRTGAGSVSHCARAFRRAVTARPGTRLARGHNRTAVVADRVHPKIDGAPRCPVARGRISPVFMRSGWRGHTVMVTVTGCWADGSHSLRYLVPA